MAASTVTIAAFHAPRTLAHAQTQAPASLLPRQNAGVSFAALPAARANCGRLRLVAVAATPSDLSNKVSESIKQAQETCADDPVSGECVAAWDEVEELSAAASHLRDRQKSADPLEEYCQDNPETDECRTYED